MTPTKRAVRSELETAVAELADKTPDAIAEMLRRRKITGRPGTTNGCPLAKLMNGTHTGAFVVGQKFIIRKAGDKVEKVPTPKNLAVFVRKFDLSQYSSLIAPPPRCLPKAHPRTKPWRSGKAPKKRVYSERKNFWSKEAGRFGDAQAAHGKVVAK